MRDINIGDSLTLCVLLLLFGAAVLVVYLFSKKQLSKTRFLRFLGVLAIGMISSLFPFGPFGLVMGFPAVLLSSILVSLFLDRE
jgi:hypothetical protein